MCVRESEWVTVRNTVDDNNVINAVDSVERAARFSEVRRAFCQFSIIMGGVLSSTRRPSMTGRARQDCRILILRHGDPKDLIFPECWKANDVLYQRIESERKMQMTNDPGSIMITIAVYSPCEVRFHILLY